jgi:hypothetical protein
MDIRLNNLTQDFTNIVELKDDNIKTLDILIQKINKLKEIYAEFIKNNKQSIFIFGLDSFHFQGKLIDIEYEDMNRLFLAITNRMYCEYFKLYKIIIEYISNNITDPKLLDLIKISNNYPVYKDLEPFKLYNFEIIQNIHEIIITLLHSINQCIINKERDLDAHKVKNNTGLNIDNFVTTFNFNIVIMREKLTLFVTYIEFFHKLHNKYLKRFTTKLQLMFSQINNDIKFDDTDQTKRLRDIKDDNVDNTLLVELHHSMNDSSVSSPNDATTNTTTTNTTTTNTTNSELHDLFPEIVSPDECSARENITLNIDNDNISIIEDVAEKDIKEDEPDLLLEKEEKVEEVKENKEVQTIKIKRAYKPKKPKN